jgi:hypothetical protein
MTGRSVPDDDDRPPEKLGMDPATLRNLAWACVILLAVVVGVLLVVRAL